MMFIPDIFTVLCKHGTCIFLSCHCESNLLAKKILSYFIFVIISKITVRKENHDCTFGQGYGLTHFHSPCLFAIVYFYL